MKRIFLTYCLLLTTILVWSQSTVATGVPYDCGFENAAELSAWVMNPQTPTATDKWMVGTAVHCEGRHSMYISSDSVNPIYGRNRNIAVSYLRYQFPTASTTQKYDISFDWKGVGECGQSQLYVMLCPETFLLTPGQNPSNYIGNIVSTTTGVLSNATVNECALLGENREQYLCGSEAWQNVTFSDEVSIAAPRSSITWALVFIWVNNNNNQNDTVSRSSIAIDNVQINSAMLKKPANLQAIPQCDDSTMLVTWEGGSASEFDVEYRKAGELNWTGEYALTTTDPGFEKEGSSCSYTLRRIEEGSYDVRVRGANPSAGLKTSWVYKTLIIVYCPENHCINYVDLYDTARVVCTYGMHPNAVAGATPYDNVGVLDYGPDAMESRHTLHVDPNEFDPRTDSLLHTVCPGALASVRLGNWNTGAEAEAITYNITVDTMYQGILLVHYAVVFENPQGHPREDEPAFELVVLDQNGQEIDSRCGKAEFTYSSATDDNSGWNITRDQQVAWKDWTTVGIPLMGYQGQNIKVRFTTYDCSWYGHYGYAYFTVDCANAHIETNNCGNDASISCIAPEGFNYYWYNELGDSIDNKREITVDASMHTYTCRASFIGEPTCFFEISTVSAPRFPVPEYTTEHSPYDCKNMIRFANSSHVMTKFDGEENHTSEPCTAFDWQFRSLSGKDISTPGSHGRNPSLRCSNEGDSIEVILTSYIGVNNACDSTRIDTVYVPRILTDTAIYKYTTCPESPVKFDGEWFEKDTVYVSKYTNWAGCDSVSILQLKVYPNADTYIHDSICSDQRIQINGVWYNEPLDNYKIDLKTVHGCDSILYLTLTVNERIKQSLDTVPYSCADEENLYIPLMIDKGMYDSLAITFSTPELRDTVLYTNVSEVNIPYPANITPGSYTATFTYYQFCCGTHTFTRTVDVRYRSSIVEQKWNDVLTILSPKYNGGFEFTAYQWYKDGEPILGENHSYLYQPLDLNSTYYVELTRADGVVITTCPMQPTYHEQQSQFPTLVTAGKKMPMYMAHTTTVWYYTMSGQLYSTFEMPQGYTSLDTPAQPGVYILKSVNSEGEMQAQTMIVQ